MTAATLASFLVIYAALFAFIGFLAFVLRGTLAPRISNRALLRFSSGAAFVLAFILWFFVLPRIL